MSASRKAWLGWLFGMLLLPPLLAFGIMLMGKWSDASVQLALIIYGISMISMGIGAAVTLTTGAAARWGMFVVFLVGMLFAQCAVFFVGCTIFVSVS